MIPCQRSRFEIPDEVAYLNCAYMSPQLRSVTAAGTQALSRKSTPWTIAASDFFTTSEAARAAFARVLGAEADGVAIVPSVSYGMAVAARNLGLAPGARVLMLADQFPSNVYPWLDLVRRNGGEAVFVPRPADGDWTRAVLAHLDERVGIAALPHCHWTDGSLVGLARVHARCREVGAALVLDLTQSLGALPFHVAEVPADFVVAASYKWLLGPYSVGFLYADPRWHGGEALEQNWIARAGSEDFAGLVRFRDAYQAGARRFDVGERSNFALMPMALEALEQVQSWSIPAIAETIGALTDRIAAGAADLGLAVLPAHLRARHMLGLRFPGGVPPVLLERLAAARVYVSVRGDSVRVSPHLYNTSDDADRLLDILAATR